MWQQLQIRAAKSKAFWILLRVMRRIRFAGRKRVLFSSEKYVAANTSARLLVELIRITSAPFTFALGSAFLLLIAELYLPELNVRWIPIPLWHLADRDSYATLLGTISGIGGVLIGGEQRSICPSPWRAP
jgi:hypothetical protein